MIVIRLLRIGRYYIACYNTLILFAIEKMH